MKPIWAIALNTLSLLLSATSVLGQATFVFRNADGRGVNAPVFDAQGSPLAGTNYAAELWGAASSNSLMPLVLLGQGTRLIKPFATGGYVNQPDGGYLVVTTVAPSGFGWLQMRAWDARLGKTYEDVVTVGIGGYGESPLFYAQGGDPFDQFPELAPLIGLQSFSLRPVIPEPSTWALLALGGVAVAWAARRQRQRRT